MKLISVSILSTHFFNLEFLTHKKRTDYHDYIVILIIHYDLIADPNEEDKITAEGMMKFLDDLGLNPESRIVLILAWRFKAATQCEFSKEEFVNGMMELG